MEIFYLAGPRLNYISGSKTLSFFKRKNPYETGFYLLQDDYLYKSIFIFREAETEIGIGIKKERKRKDDR